MTPMFPCIVLASFFAAVHQSAKDDASTMNETKSETTAIYLRHVGEQDKPIFSLVVATTPPSDAEVRDRIGLDSAEDARVMDISEALLGTLLFETHQQLSQTSSRLLSPDFGTFEVTLVENESRPGRVLPAGETRIVRQLDKKAMASLLTRIANAEKASVQRSEKLRDEVSTLRSRMDVKEQR